MVPRHHVCARQSNPDARIAASFKKHPTYPRHTPLHAASQKGCGGISRIQTPIGQRFISRAGPSSCLPGGRVERTKTMSALTGFFAITILCVSAFSQAPPASPIVLKGPAMGTVKFPHAAHLRVAGRCEVCHHASKPQKPLTSPQQVCTDCHTKPPAPPVTTGLQAAFHNPSASAGLCITCHKTENSQGKAAPVKCLDCHKKDNS